ncbi:MAG: ATP-binding protein [Legionella sp.]|jgi:two-component system sensor histidine kinase PilS (NtrC family)
MPNSNLDNLAKKQWRMLLVYDVYRLISVVLFLGIFLYSPIPHPHSFLYVSILIVYFLFGLIFIYFWQNKRLHFVHQVLLSGTIDIIAISSMLSIIGNIRSGYGVLLNVTIAALSILVPGKLAIYFASLASFLLLFGNFLHLMVENEKDLSIFYYCSIYGTGFFATALTAWYLANRVQVYETIAQNNIEELAGMQRINEYIVERLNIGIIYVDEGIKIKLINSAALIFLNVPKQNSLVDLDQLSPLLAQKCSNFLATKETISETILQDPYLKVHFFFNAIAHKSAVLIILEDLMQVAQQAQQLKLAALGRFSASIAHELRNPLGAIYHAVQLFGDDGGLQTEDLRLKQLIINNCERMNRVIKNVLQLSRQEKSQPQLLQIDSFLEQFKQDFCINNECDFIIKLPEKRPVHLLFDKSLLDQVLVILCDNAMRHGRDKNGKVTLNFEVGLVANKINITIKDLGSGVPEEHKDNIFEPFFTTLRTGTGMGLFIARDLCEINQARLNLVYSNSGSCFVLTSNSPDELSNE